MKYSKEGSLSIERKHLAFLSKHCLGARSILFHELVYKLVTPVVCFLFSYSENTCSVGIDTVSRTFVKTG